MNSLARQVKLTRDDMVAVLDRIASAQTMQELWDAVNAWLDRWGWWLAKRQEEILTLRALLGYQETPRFEEPNPRYLPPPGVDQAAIDHNRERRKRRRRE